MLYTVPDTPNRPMRICVGGKDYFLQPGETVDIPSEVVSELLRALGIQHVPPDVKAPFEDKALESRVAALETGGGGLPEVTSEDNGDVLTVVEGEWAKAAPSGGGGALMVTITRTETGLILNKTWQEIYDAASTMPVVGITEDDDGTIKQNVLESVFEYEGIYYVTIAGEECTTDSATGYPEIID